MIVWRVMLVIGAVVATSGCERTFRDMYDQPRYKPLAASPLWPDGRASRPPVKGTVARSQGTLAGTTSGRLGEIARSPQSAATDTVRDDLRSRIGGTHVASFAMPPITLPLLVRGRERFDIFCSPCHSIAGDGDGMVARRGFPHPPSFHSDRLREASDAHFYAVITEGYGVMHSYADRVPSSDRLAIVAYIRALQFSQQVPATQLAESDRARLSTLAPPSNGSR
ncbi:MAG TPA: cytochrome c [Casimicrobiaceae bacterium]|nr:cytochrome c [Casimicrobiaceae bacterium]